MTLSDQAYKAREYAMEWHAELWRRYGTPEDLCRRLLDHLLACLNADYDEEPRPPDTGDPYIDAMREYLDQLFSSPHSGPQSFS